MRPSCQTKDEKSVYADNRLHQMFRHSYVVCLEYVANADTPTPM
nr:MAG TPA: hypothetical protein [Caudoviricetes sp.]